MGILIAPSHPGDILLEEFLKPLGESQIGLARKIGVDRQRVQRIVKGESGVTADTALRLGKALGTTPEFWINLQTNFDLAEARQKVDVEEIQAIAAE